MIESLIDLLAQQTSGGGTGGAIFAGGFFIVFLTIFIAASVFWLWMLVDCLISNKDGTEKVIWVLVILFLHILGALLYFFLARGKRTVT